MGTAGVVRPADALEHDIRAALTFDPIVAQDVAVAVANGVVTLSGQVASVREAVAIERAVKRVEGVRGIANGLHVKNRRDRTDTDLKREAIHRLRNTVVVPLSVEVTVTDGCVRLDGTVSWEHQRAAAENAVRYVAGVKGVINEIVVAER